jgi:streptomycin 6-kinase
MLLSPQLVANCRKNSERRRWLESLPQLLDELIARWSLRLEPPFEGSGTCSWVCPVVRAHGEQAVLKLAMPHMEGQDEIQGLRFWNRTAMVRLLEADEASGAMLLERCVPGTPLRSEPEPRQDEIIAGIVKRIWQCTAESNRPSRFRPLSEMIDFWCEEAIAQKHFWLDAGLVTEGIRVMKKLSRPSSTDVLLATDLHAGNILGAQRELWLAIDPKPFLGDRTYDLTQHLINCEARLHRNPIALIERIAGLAAVDPERLRLWTFARAAAGPRDDWTNPVWIDIAKALSP